MACADAFHRTMATRNPKDTNRWQVCMAVPQPEAASTLAGSRTLRLSKPPRGQGRAMRRLLAVAVAVAVADGSGGIGEYRGGLISHDGYGWYDGNDILWNRRCDPCRLHGGVICADFRNGSRRRSDRRYRCDRRSDRRDWRCGSHGVCLDHGSGGDDGLRCRRRADDCRRCRQWGNHRSVHRAATEQSATHGDVANRGRNHWPIRRDTWVLGKCLRFTSS